MGVFDKLFKKRGEPPLDAPADPFGQQYPAFDAGADQYAGAPSYDQFEQTPQYDQQPQSFSPEQAGFERVPAQQSWPAGQSASDISLSKDMELINAKLDAIKAELDSVNQRLKRIERLAEEPSGQQRKDVWSY